MHKIVRELGRGVILLALILILVSLGCLEELRFEPKLTGKTGALLEPSTRMTCELRARESIPEQLELIRDGDRSWRMLDDQRWNDGSAMVEAPFNHFYRGMREGQNINYYYSSMELYYSKRIISAEGKIVGTRTFAIKPVVKPIEGTNATYIDRYGLEREMKKFEIVDPNFVECNWVFILEIME